MTLLPSAVSLSRALVGLARARSTGVLTVCAPYDVCRIAIVGGVPRAATSKRGGPTLGDVLLRGGDLDVVAHLRALSSSPKQEPAGVWLVRHGAASRPAVEHALRVQLRERILDAFRFQGLDYRFVPGDADVGAPWVTEPVSTSDLVLSAMRRVVDRAATARCRLALRHARLVLSPLGRALVQDAALWPDEAAMLPLLEAGASLVAIDTATRGAERARTTLCALVLLSAVESRDAPRERYQLLLRKHRQLRARASATDLLDLERDAQAPDAGRALRRLARRLHPDALGPDVSPLLRARSCEIMSALGDAERAVRASGAQARSR